MWRHTNKPHSLIPARRTCGYQVGSVNKIFKSNYRQLGLLAEWSRASDHEFVVTFMLVSWVRDPHIPWYIFAIFFKLFVINYYYLLLFIWLYYFIPWYISTIFLIFFFYQLLFNRLYSIKYSASTEIKLGYNVHTLFIYFHKKLQIIINLSHYENSLTGWSPTPIQWAHALWICVEYAYEVR